MSSNNHSSQDHDGQDPQPSSGEQEHAGHSGEGAASALAQLRSQRQHRRQLGDIDERSGGPGQ